MNRPRKLLFMFLTTVVFLFLFDNMFWLMGYRNLSPIFRDRVHLRRFDKKYGSSLRPGAVVGDCRINSQGYREDYDIPLKRPENEVVRGLALGDSIIFGAKVKNKEALCCQLEKILDRHIQHGRAEIINTAVMWWGPSQFLIRYLSEGKAFAPDFVLVGLCPNDVTDVLNFENMVNSKSIVEYDFHRRKVAGDDLGSDSFMGKIILRMTSFLVSHSSFCNAVYDFAVARKSKQLEQKHLQMLHSMTEEQLLRPYLDKMDELVQAVTEPKVFILFPSINFLKNIPDRKYFPYEKTYRKETLQLLDAANVPCLDVATVYREYLQNHPEQRPEDLFAGDIHHPSALGHKLTAEAVFKILCSQKYIESACP